MAQHQHQRPNAIERFAAKSTWWAGSTTAFILAVLSIVIWLVTGPLFHWSDTWQLVANTVTTVITFLMVFLIQRTQNKDSLALQLKLNEIVAAIEGASNRLIDVEDLSEMELHVLHKHYEELAEMAAHDVNLDESHSIDEAKMRHAIKKEHRRRRR